MTSAYRHIARLGLFLKTFETKQEGAKKEMTAFSVSPSRRKQFIWKILNIFWQIFTQQKKQQFLSKSITSGLGLRDGLWMGMGWESGRGGSLAGTASHDLRQVPLKRVFTYPQGRDSQACIATSQKCHLRYYYYYYYYTHFYLFQSFKRLLWLDFLQTVSLANDCYE